MFVTKLVPWLLATVRRHQTALNAMMDPIENNSRGNRESESNPSSSPPLPNSMHYLFAALYITVGFGYGTFGMHYAVEGHFGPDFPAASPYTMVHQFVPRPSWAAIDMVILIDFFAAIPLYTVFACRSHAAIAKHRLTISGGGGGRAPVLQVDHRPFLTESESRKFLLHRRRLKLGIQSVFGALFTMLMAEFSVYVWAVHAVYDRVPLPLMIVYWSAGFTPAWFYMVYGLFTSTIYVMIVGRLIRVRQRSILVAIDRAAAELRFKHHNFGAIASHWRRYEQANRRLVALCSLTKRYAHHCLPVVSVVLPYYITVQVYMVYAVIFLDSEEPEFFLTIVIEVNVCLFVVINQCAAVAVQNRSVERANARFGYRFQREVRRFAVDGQPNSKQLFTRQLIKCFFWQSHKRLHPYTFRAVGNFRIGSGTYPLILTYIGGAFIFITKQQRRHLVKQV